MSKLLCPYCFRRYDLNQIHWRCMSNNCKNPNAGPNEPPGEIDQIYARFQTEFQIGSGMAANRLAHAFASPPETSLISRALGVLHMRNKINCDWCGKETTIRLCPECHNILPYTAGETDSHIIAILGAKEVGKSHYIAVLIEQIKEAFGAGFGFGLTTLNDNTRDRYKKSFFEPLYRNRQKIEKTQARPEPLMFRLTFRKPDNPIQRSRTLTLVFFDTAGENLDSEDAIKTFNRYLTHASAIILLLDPLQMHNIRQDLGSKGCPLPQAHTEPEEIVDRIINVFHQSAQIKANEKISVPVALSLTKADALRRYGVLNEGSAVYTQPQHKNVFQRRVYQQIHDEIEATIVNWSGMKLKNLLDSEFKNYSYFCSSSLGESPDLSGSLARIAPFRVEDPFLWCLSQLGYIKLEK